MREPGSAKRWLWKVATLAVVTVAFGHFYAWAAPHAFPMLPVPGFCRGVLHGALMPMALPSLVLDRDVPIYADVNSGRFYKLGYIVGINLCGLVFFGPIFLASGAPPGGRQRKPMTMLYQLWRQTAAARPGEMALRDGASGRRWTFAQLADEAERQAAPEGVVHPRGHGPEFIFAVLAAWRENKAVWPLEGGYSPPPFSPPPRCCIHVKRTSGSTGEPRLAAFTPSQLAADAANIVAAMGLRADQPNLGVISMAHSYGFSNLVTPLLFHGIPLILAPSVLPEAIRLAAAREKCLTLAAVPAMWRSWHEARAIPSNIRLAISAGAPLPLALEREIFQSSGLKVHNFYGASECGGIAYDASETPRADGALAGTPLGGVKLSLNGDGCLRVQSRAVGETYWPQATEALAGGNFQTMDVAELREGMVFLRGGLSDQINVAGRKLWPQTVEQALLAHPRVRQCLVLGVPSEHAERTETVMAVVAASASEAELKEFLLETLPAWQVPREWHFVDSIPTSPRGKISRAEWRQRLLAEPLP